MLTPLDTPTAADVLRGHQLDAWGRACSCGEALPGGDARRALADHQLATLQASDLAVVSIHGTAGVVKAAAVVVAAYGAGKPIAALHDALLLLRQRVEAMTK